MGVPHEEQNGKRIGKGERVWSQSGIDEGACEVPVAFLEPLK